MRKGNEKGRKGKGKGNLKRLNLRLIFEISVFHLFLYGVVRDYTDGETSERANNGALTLKYIYILLHVFIFHYPTLKGEINIGLFFGLMG
jgi:hypothetical protein